MVIYKSQNTVSSSYLALCHTCQISKWLVLSSRPAASLAALFLKSSYPSPPLITNILEANVVVAAMDDRRWMSCRARFSLSPSSPSSSPPSTLTEGEVTVISTHVKNRTCPVCPLTNPVKRRRKSVVHGYNEMLHVKYIHVRKQLKVHVIPFGNKVLNTILLYTHESTIFQNIIILKRVER